MQRYVTLRMRVASPASRSPLAFVPCRRISITRSIIGLFRKETRDAIKNTPGLQQVGTLDLTASISELTVD